VPLTGRGGSNPPSDTSEQRFPCQQRGAWPQTFAGGPPAARMSPYTRRLLIYLLIAILIGRLVYAFFLANSLNESTF
jgi:hypothetical protein